MDKNYSSAKVLAYIIIVVGWIVALLTIAGAVFSVIDGEWEFAIFGFAGGAVSAILIVAAGQILLAVIDTAVNTRRTAELLRAIYTKEHSDPGDV